MSDNLIERLLRQAKRDDGSLDPLLLEAASCIRDLRACLATAESDALERAAKWHDGRAMQIIQQTKMHDFDNGPAKVMSREDGSIAVAHHRQSAAAIRALKPKADE